jgi:hypothetical protein
LKKLKKEGFIFTITVVLGILSLFAVGLNILALNDIYHDYTSLGILEMIGQESNKDLPAWSRCTGEWIMLRYGHLVLVLFFIFLIITLLKKGNPKPIDK